MCVCVWVCAECSTSYKYTLVSDISLWLCSPSINNYKLKGLNHYGQLPVIDTRTGYERVGGEREQTVHFRKCLPNWFNKFNVCINVGLLLIVSLSDAICSTGKILLFRMSALSLRLQRKPYYNFIAGKLEPNVVCISIILSYPWNKSILYRLNHRDSDEKRLITPWQPKAGLLFFPSAIFKKLSIKDFLSPPWLGNGSTSAHGGAIVMHLVWLGAILNACLGFKF